MKTTIRELLTILYLVTFDRNRRAWRGCYRVHGGVIHDQWGGMLLVMWANWAVAAGCDPWPHVSIRRVG